MIKEEYKIDQEVVFDDVQSTVMHNVTKMKESIEKQKAKKVLKYAFKALVKLGNPHLEPKYYYSVCKFFVLLSYVNIQQLKRSRGLFHRRTDPW